MFICATCAVSCDKFNLIIKLAACRGIFTHWFAHSALTLLVRWHVGTQSVEKRGHVSQKVQDITIRKTTLDLHEARDDGVWGWQWRQLDHMQTICTWLQTDNHSNSTTPHNSIFTGDMLFLTPNSVSKHWRHTKLYIKLFLSVQWLIFAQPCTV